jgi:hypothetical protein
MAPIAFRWARFSLLSCLPREKTTDTHYSPFLGSPEMSDKLRYEWHCWVDVRTNDGCNARTNDGGNARTNDGCNGRTYERRRQRTYERPQRRLSSNYFVGLLYMEPERMPMPVSSANIKQYFWREKQLDIFYRTGRPIFNMDKHTLHLRSHNNPHYFKEPQHQFWQHVFSPYIHSP